MRGRHREFPRLVCTQDYRWKLGPDGRAVDLLNGVRELDCFAVGTGRYLVTDIPSCECFRADDLIGHRVRNSDAALALEHYG
jgi:hypothetical protein